MSFKLSNDKVEQLAHMTEHIDLSERIRPEECFEKFDLSKVEIETDEELKEIQEGLRDLKRVYTLRAPRVDRRTLSSLKRMSIDAEKPLDRERALWQISERFGRQQLSHMADLAHYDPDRRVRISALWAILKHSIGQFDKVYNFLLDFRDEDPEVQDWAQMFLREILSVAKNDLSLLPNPNPCRDYEYRKNQQFDQTLPLLICGYAVTRFGPSNFRIFLPPLWFQSIVGRVMACIRADTFERRLVIEKKLDGLHPDGSSHFEIFKFTGDTETQAEGVYLHRYWSSSGRTFYTSGRTEEVSSRKPAIENVRVNLARVAQTVKSKYARMGNDFAVESVRGQFFGYAYVNPWRFIRSRFQIRAGDVQLSAKTDRILKGYCNTYIYGTFRGKLSDTDGDTRLDVNTIPCHATSDGTLDYKADGSLDSDPFDFFQTS